MRKLLKEAHCSPYSGQAAEYADRIMGDVDMVYTNKWTWNAEYRFAWKVDSRGWISVMKVKPFKVAGEREYGYVVYGLSKDGTLREKSWDSWRDIDEAWDRIKMIFKLDIPQPATESTIRRGGNQMKKKLVKEGWYKGELLKNAIDAAKEAKVLLTQASQDIRKAWGEEHDIFVWLDSEKNNVDDIIFDMQNTLDVLPYDEYKAMVAEAKGRDWFNEYGQLQKRIPKACVDACSGPGRKDQAVEYWVDKLKFYIPDNLIEQAMDYLREFGAWDEFELQEWADTEDLEHNLAQHVLWSFCGDLYDGNVRQGELYLGH